MAIFNLRRKRKVRKSRRGRPAAPLAAPVGLSGPVLRVNRLVAAIALFGAFGTMALAVALTPGNQPSGSSARASQEVLATNEMTPQADLLAETLVAETAVAETSQPAPAPAALPLQLAKSDRLDLKPPEPRSAKVDLSPGDPWRGGPDESAPGERDAAMAGQWTSAQKQDIAGAPEPGIEAGVEPRLEFALSEPPAPGDARLDDVESAIVENDGSEFADDDAKGAAEFEVAVAAPIEEPVEEPVEAAIEEPVEAAVAAPVEEPVEAAIEEPLEPAVEEPVEAVIEEPAPEPAPATRSASVRTDVNMRARPDNSAAVILVVPGSSDVEVISCNYWCEVIYAGKRGWIYKGFVSGAKS